LEAYFLTHPVFLYVNYIPASVHWLHPCICHDHQPKTTHTVYRVGQKWHHFCIPHNFTKY